VALTKAQRRTQRKKHKHCYVCKALNLSHSSFTGYVESDVQFDHWGFDLISRTHPKRPIMAGEMCHEKQKKI
jgi:hypothetical protein